jgi:general secretion pathway protein G
MRNTQSGFSLIEIMIVITLLGLIGTFAVTNYMARQQEGNRKGAKILMQTLRGTLDDYFRICSAYPTNAQGGLEALAKGPADGSCKEYTPANASIKKVPKDPWGMDFFYLSDDGRKYVLKSFGADKREGGEGNDKDISTEDADF